MKRNKENQSPKNLNGAGSDISVGGHQGEAWAAMPVPSSVSINVTGEQNSRRDEGLELCAWHEAEAQLSQGKLNLLPVAEVRQRLAQLWPSLCVGQRSVAGQWNPCPMAGT